MGDGRAEGRFVDAVTFMCGLTVKLEGHQAWLGDPSESWPLAAA
ncbi:hypothetical protein [Streptomyces antimycoticus]